MTVAATPREDSLPAMRARTLFVLWTTYGSFYFCRANVGQAVKSMRADLGYTALQMGFVLGAAKLGYAAGQFVNGQLTERFGARRILGIGMVGSSAATALFALAPELAASSVGGWLGAPVRAVARAFGADLSTGGPLALMVLLAFLNGWFQAGGWPPCVKVAANWFPVEHRGRTMGILGTSYTVGSALAMLAVGALLRANGNAWRIAFVLPAVILTLSAIHTSTLRERPPGPATHDPQRAQAAPAARLSIGEALAATFGNPRIWILALGLFGLDAVRYGFLDWAPSQLADMQGSDVFAASLKTAVFPLAGALGTLSSNWLTDRFFDSRRAPVCALMLGCLGGLTLGYRAVLGLGAAPTVICLALAGFCLYGAQILLVGTAAQDFARRGATAAAAGFVDFTGHVGAFSGDVITGWIVRRYGWVGAISWWSAAAFASAGLVATLWRARAGDSERSRS
ncbi:MAG TPA: MFS transporter [Polyangiaceae bacterium]|nr:MFS transporter [Polyangiaceae bacterium]